MLSHEAGDVMGTLLEAMLGPAALRGQCTLSERIARTWHRGDCEDLIRRALVLLADHELNASTFATRVAVSTGASLSAGVLAGLSTLSGPLHGGAAAPTRALLEATQRLGAAAAVHDWLAQGRPLPAFGHPLYPDGDIRARALLDALPVQPLHAELCTVVEGMTGERPNIDFALATLSDSLHLPFDAPFILFALGRCAGWLAHAIEQVQARRLIRPRARYIGVSVPISGRRGGRSA
jgi:citrate synthase